MFGFDDLPVFDNTDAGSGLFDWFGGGGGSDAGDLFTGGFDPSILGGGIDLGGANPATFAEAGGPALSGPSMEIPSAENTTAEAGGVTPTPSAVAGQEQAMVPPKNPALESQQQPGQWWQTMANNAATSIQKNPWTAAGYGLAGIGALTSAIQSGMQPSSLPPMRFPSYPGSSPLTNTNADPTLPKPGAPVSPLLRKGNMNVKMSTGLQ